MYVGLREAFGGRRFTAMDDGFTIAPRYYFLQTHNHTRVCTKKKKKKKKKKKLKTQKSKLKTQNSLPYKVKNIKREIDVYYFSLARLASSRESTFCVWRFQPNLNPFNCKKQLCEKKKEKKNTVLSRNLMHILVAL